MVSLSQVGRTYDKRYRSTVSEAEARRVKRFWESWLHFKGRYHHHRLRVNCALFTLMGDELRYVTNQRKSQMNEIILIH